MLSRLTYNAQNQVASTNVPAPSWAPYFCWAYDAFGNRLQQSTSNAAFTAGDATCTVNGTQYQNTLASYSAQNQVASTNAPGFTWTPSYDNAGDVTNDGKNQYLYDAEGRLCAVESEGNYTGYLYDAAGNRVAKGTISTWSCDITTNGFVQTAGYVVGPSGEQLTEVDSSNNWKHTNVYADGKQIATYDSVGLHFYFDDPLGTRRAQANSSGVLEAVYVSLPFGDGYAANTSDDPTENHYTGKERDTESGNDYFDARYYNSATGRFLSPDWSAKEDPVPYAKLDNPQTLNLYAYVVNNPLVKVDVDGHAGCTVDWMPDAGCAGINADSATVDNGPGLSIGGVAIKRKSGPPARVVRTGKHVYRKPHKIQSASCPNGQNGCYFEGTTYRYKVVDDNNNIVRNTSEVDEHLSQVTSIPNVAPPTATQAFPTNGQFSDYVGYGSSTKVFPSGIESVVNQTFTAVYGGQIWGLSTQIQQTVTSDSSGNVVGVSHTIQP